MKLTYRGISYQTPTPDKYPEKIEESLGLDQHFINREQDKAKIMLIRPIHYYTYRGVSYTKNLIFDHHSNIVTGY